MRGSVKVTPSRTVRSSPSIGSISGEWNACDTVSRRVRTPRAVNVSASATVSACATGGHAIGESWETIRRGDARIMVAGGSEAGIFEALVGGFASMRALSTRNDDPAGASRPFDTWLASPHRVEY